MNSLLPALTLGFLGSFHCVGMCGPIALALPLNRESLFSRIFGALLYNFGRAFMYALFGGLFGLLGQSLVLAGYQQALSISIGVAILVVVLLPSSMTNKFKITAIIYSYLGNIKQKLAVLFKKSNFSSLFFIGILNGLLPCGLVYLGIAGAIATGDGIQGSFFMFLFGLGTIPAMISLNLISSSISVNFRNKINKIVPVFVVFMALLLILRGLNLGIPYVSPKMSSTAPVCSKCCHK
ncbi:MAG: sulfite exporter TauE/SafE family protein [Bacteroidetes bacterium]|nr:sulfite exporter TauE/SafE family protein [Bacteroidota bacterium]